MSRGWLWLLGGLVLLIALEGTYRRIRTSVHPAAGAEWIWRKGETSREARPTSFFAVKDFELASAPQRARLLILGDEEYRVTLNGRFLGGNRYWRGMPLDDFDVSKVLVPGLNRLVVQLRSERGGGGLLASLQEVEEDGGTRTLLETDRSWGIVPGLTLGMERGWQPFEDVEIPRSWGKAPVGRWGLPRLGPARSLPALLGAPRSLQPTEGLLPDPAPPDLLLDWGRPVTGYLALELAPGSPRIGKVLLGEAPGVEGSADQAVAVIAGDLDLYWRDARPQRFRYARVQGLTGLRNAFVDPAGEGELPQAPSASAHPAFEAWAPPHPSPSDLAVREALGRP
ncbi:MAG: hypothetical protein KDD47_23420 [Acidobacteria bacterium]|nr:hypothetical protein [Acidobacteriota bacterium]